MTLTIEVTAEDIEKGERRDCRFCPLARAASRAAGLSVDSETRIEAGLYSLWLDTPRDSHVIARFPRVATDWMSRFDHRAGVEPFTFTVDIPDADLERIKQASVAG